MGLPFVNHDHLEEDGKQQDDEAEKDDVAKQRQDVLAEFPRAEDVCQITPREAHARTVTPGSKLEGSAFGAFGAPIYHSGEGKEKMKKEERENQDDRTPRFVDPRWAFLYSAAPLEKPPCRKSISSVPAAVI